ncbi:hypothetical protein E6R60_13150 [Streptomyces sp. A0642]|uniref:hypothetical protein n=1 Tax=Streptomyces sp. A0642 TaxID=2563100 RepID=UPI0010A24C3C|nr:hypothetical protein [Streptomyces sp. A0642]THA76537.1 hypothetical protein E6R60_13150 [Streptomyces sp. A0642]
MSHAGKRWYRGGAVAGAAALLLVGCGGGDEDGGTAKALGKAEVSSVLPDAKAVPGWRTVMTPDAQEPNPEFPPSVCLAVDEKKRETACGDVAYWGASAYARKPDGTSLNFWTLAYKDEKSADAAYDVLAEHYGGDRVGVGAVAVGIGEPGDEREAHRAEMGTMGGPATITQVRVGTTVLGISTGTQGKKAVSDQEAKDFAAMFAERAQQAQDGKRPSAAVAGR